MTSLQTRGMLHTSTEKTPEIPCGMRLSPLQSSFRSHEEKAPLKSFTTSRTRAKCSPRLFQGHLRHFQKFIHVIHILSTDPIQTYCLIRENHHHHYRRTKTRLPALYEQKTTSLKMIPNLTHPPVTIEKSNSSSSLKGISTSPCPNINPR